MLRERSSFDVTVITSRKRPKASPRRNSTQPSAAFGRYAGRALGTGPFESGVKEPVMSIPRVRAVPDAGGLSSSNSSYGKPPSLSHLAPYALAPAALPESVRLECGLGFVQRTGHALIQE